MKNPLPTIVTIAILFLANYSIAQTPFWAWAKQPNGTSNNPCWNVTTDANGNVYVVGEFNSSTINFGNYTLTNNGGRDFFIVKYDPSGNVLWAKNAGGYQDDYGTSITTDVNGNLISSGIFESDSIKFGAFTLYKTGGAGVNFMVKYDASGNVIWAKVVATGGGNVVLCITSNNNGNIFMTGDFDTPNIAFGSIILNNSGGNDIFIVKCDSAGNPIWAKSAIGIGDEDSFSVAADDSGHAYITGSFYSPTLTFDTITLTNVNGFSSNDIFLAKYDSAVNVIWARMATGGITNDYAYGVTCDPSGNVYLTGSYASDSLTFGSITLINPLGNEVIVVKYDSNGNAIWARQSTGFTEAAGYVIKSDASGNVIIAGYFKDNAVAFGNITLTNAGQKDVFIAKYNANGNVVFAKRAGGIYDDIAYGVCFDPNGNVLVTGYFISPNIIFGTDTLLDKGPNSLYNGFVAKLDVCYTQSSITVAACDSFISPSGNYVWTTSGSYTDIVPGSSGCDSVITINLTINTVSDSAYQVGNLLVAYTSGASYQWLDCNNGYTIIPGATNQGYIPAIAGNYAVAITKFGCTDSSICFAVTGVGLNEQFMTNNFDIYPNPVNDILVICYPSVSNKEVSVSISDDIGKVIYSKTTSSSKIEINTSDFERGVYFVKLQTKDFVETKKMIKN